MQKKKIDLIIQQKENFFLYIRAQLINMHSCFDATYFKIGRFNIYLGTSQVAQW